MPKTLIESFPKEERQISDTDLKTGKYLEISEFFYDTIQGENLMGNPAAFLRTQRCTLHCHFCDTLSVWKRGNKYTFDELLKMIEEVGLVEKFKKGQRLILTGGSPLLQQDRLVKFFAAFEHSFGFLPTIEVENEAVIKPKKELIQIVSVWNNSPKTFNSNNKKEDRYKPEVLKFMSGLINSWFKFVVRSLSDWEEIDQDYLTPGLIRREQLVLMPMGEDQRELNQTREAAIELAVRENVRYCDRLHVVAWNKKTGV